MKVLVVDDRPENRMILETKMRAQGFTVATAANGLEALQALRGGGFELVVTDLMMPRMDGYQLTHAIKTDDDLKAIPVLVYTATYTDPKDEALAMNLGANGFVLKPASDEEFFSTVQAIVDRARRGELTSRTPTREELVYLRQYSERLISKLEAKVAEHEDAERQLRELNASLERRIADAVREMRQTNEDLDAFAYSVSHDLRAPLRSIEEYLDLVLSSPEEMPGSELREYVGRARSLALRGQQLITDLLEYARVKSAPIDPSPVQVRAAVEAAVAQLDAGSRRNASIRQKLGGEVVVAHERTLVQVLHNLIGNAIKFARPGQQPVVDISAEKRGDVVRLVVRDDGIGIPKDAQTRIFKPFERAHGERIAGSGLGLAIVERGVRKMGGTVGVESEPGQGSTFWIELRSAS